MPLTISQYQWHAPFVGVSTERKYPLSVVMGKTRIDGNYIPLDLAATLLFTNKKSLRKMLKRGDIPYARSWRGVMIVKQADVLAYQNSGNDIEGVNGYSRPNQKGSGGGGGVSGFLDDLGDFVGDLGDLSL